MASYLCSTECRRGHGNLCSDSCCEVSINFPDNYKSGLIPAHKRPGQLDFYFTEFIAALPVLPSKIYILKYSGDDGVLNKMSRSLSI